MKRLPVFNGYTVDFRLSEFRKVVYGKSIEFIPFNSKEGRRILLEMRPEMNKIFWDDADIISSYTLQQAIADGSLVEVLPEYWDYLTDGTPLVATKQVYHDFTTNQLREALDRYMAWRFERHGDRYDLYPTTINQKKVWIIEDGQAITFLYPEEY